VPLVGFCMAKGVPRRSAEGPVVDRGHDWSMNGCAAGLAIMQSP
jgi:hypothetical protein